MKKYIIRRIIAAASTLLMVVVICGGIFTGLVLNACTSRGPVTTGTTSVTGSINYEMASAAQSRVTMTTTACATTVYSGQSTAPSYYGGGTSNYTTSPTTATLGLAAGGAKDINNFRQNIFNGFLPLPTDVTYEGLFYDYYFDTGKDEVCNKLFCPAYSYAVTRDPLSGQPDYYLSVGLNSGIKENDFQRKTLNLVIVMDVSGSMGSSYNQYYYDNTGKQVNAYEGEGINYDTKLDSSKKAVESILGKLDTDDKFAIVLFDETATLYQPMVSVRNVNIWNVQDNVNRIQLGGSTNMAAGLNMGYNLFGNSLELNQYEYENRVILITDAQPNTGDISLYDFTRMVDNNAAQRIYTTFIGVGVDFNSQLIEAITKAKGANYYTIRSPREFRERIEEEFDFMVTPLVFDLQLNFESPGWRIEKVFGSPQADAATGNLMKVNTLFPSKSVNGQTKGGLVLLKLQRTSSNTNTPIYLRTTYEDRNGRKDGGETVIRLDTRAPEYFDNAGIRKGILLSRYTALLKNWIIDERSHTPYNTSWTPAACETRGIVIPNENLSQWERTSLSLNVSYQYQNILRNFRFYFEREMSAIGDDSLQQEAEVLRYLTR